MIPKTPDFKHIMSFNYLCSPFFLFGVHDLLEKCNLLNSSPASTLSLTFAFGHLEWGEFTSVPFSLNPAQSCSPVNTSP